MQAEITISRNEVKKIVKDYVGGLFNGEVEIEEITADYNKDPQLTISVRTKEERANDLQES